MKELINKENIEQKFLNPFNFINNLKMLENGEIQQFSDILSIEIEQKNSYKDEKPLSMREQFRNQLYNQINNSEKHRLPYLESINNEELLDSETIITINNTTSTEIRIKLMEKVLNHTNSIENSAFLLKNSPEQVLSYVHNLILRNVSNQMVMENELYPIGNIFMYTISNIVGIQNVGEVIDSLNNSMFLYNNNRIFSTLSDQIVKLQQETQEIITTSIQESHVRLEECNRRIENIRLATEQKIKENTIAANLLIDEMGRKNQEQMQQRSDEFQKKVEERIIANKKNALVAGATVASTAVLVSMGMPPIVSVLIKTLSSIFKGSNN